jgi:putative (di)nucleoside polyphosphate hydrolase
MSKKRGHSIDPVGGASAWDAGRIAALPYRPGVGIMLLDGQGRVFVARRIDTSAEAWQMPQGGIDADETPVEAAWREMEEEIGTRAATLLAESHGWLRYDLPHELVPRVWRGRFRGQEQKWFAFRFTGSDGDINLATASPEFHDWKWVERAELPRLIVPFKRVIYQQVIDEFAGL